ncbi:hypothetical protein JOF53_004195 [Crossiella equi]|uniref:Uridine kinase n=1 Tax=Crossiella equi TaxID=130796 RepID=A0ABS5AFG2_9PSEU|nr:uridine kinase [Crossiella equi]MBP2475323.1 hypothetical protein [Crossiella equi]
MREAADLLLAAPARLGGVRLAAVDGPSGAGKTTRADELVSYLLDRGHQVGLVPADHFATWDDPVAWWPRLVTGVLAPLAAGRPGRYQRTAWTDGQPHLADWVDVPVPEILVLEGVSTGRKSVSDRLSGLFWVELANAADRLERAVARDGEMCRDPLRRWQEFEVGWFAVDRTRQRADRILVAEGHRKIG